MVTVLLALGLFIVVLQLGLMSLVRRLAQQLDIERARIDKLERARAARAAEGDNGEFVSTLGVQTTRPAAREVEVAASPTARAEAPEAMVSPKVEAADKPDPAELRGEMLGLMGQLVEQGLSVRDIASRCGLSEAEAELMLSLHAGKHA